MHPNAQLITRFYEAFAKHDAEAMADCYADDIIFSDPAFGRLEGEQAGNMWRMLLMRSNGQLEISFEGVTADDDTGEVTWEAKYPFSKTGRKVHNVINARFVFRDGKIAEHHDNFDFWRWSRQALGMTGTLLGWSPMLRNKVRAQAHKGLHAFAEKQEDTK